MRDIKPAMIKFIDDKLAKNGLAQKAIEEKDARTLFRLAAEACVGIREEGGNNRGPMVKLIQETIGSANAEAWCMSFMQTCIAYAEIKTGKVSPIYPSEHCMTTWNKTPKSARVKIFPLSGAIVIWQHGKGPAGHTGVFLEANESRTKMTTVEGNTSSGLLADGSLNRDGGAVLVCNRSTKANGSMKVVGFLKPF
jgi:hypothetical protein